VSEKAPDFVLDRTVKVRFDSNTAPGLPWKFKPEQNEVTVRIGEVTTVHYKVTNEAARSTLGQASYNVTPPTVGAYFNKINCFCFTEQRFKPGETREMAVVFYVDPALAKDSEHDTLKSITLSYTFFPLPDKATPVADANDKPASAGKL
jgi:cytochrome c oxidase assembly protein subunit 11